MSWLNKLKRASKRSEPEDEEPKLRYRLFVDSPRSKIVSDRKLLVRGWIIANSGSVHSMRIKNGAKYHKLPYGLERKDVLRKTKGYDKRNSLYSGFETIINYVEGNLSIDVDLGDGYEKIWESEIVYAPEKTFDLYYNPNLANNVAEHRVLLDNKKSYYYEPEIKKSYSRKAKDPRLVAFYLPQFHPIKENDIAWGKGFTEWANVTAGEPRFIGHQQPFLPADLGFYDLRIEENIENQIKMAKKHGIYAFCFYYYWFGGVKLLEKPLDVFLNHKEWDFKFMICWANENWTRRWDGHENEVIIAQKYLKSDPLKFIKDVEHILLDPRYIRQNNKPLIAIYRGLDLQRTANYAQVWREYFKKKHNLGLEIVTMFNRERTDPRSLGFDSGVEFAPMTDRIKNGYNRATEKSPKWKNKLLDPMFDGYIADYRALFSDSVLKESFEFPTYKCVTPSWDNEARKKGTDSLTLYGANPDLYALWLDYVLASETAQAKSPLVFINAWNEWAEGAVLEPSNHLGYSVLNRTREVLAKYSDNKANLNAFPQYSIKKGKATKLAVIVHIYQEKDWSYIQGRLKILEGINHDLYVTVTEKDRKILNTILRQSPNSVAQIVPNRGRDILPFLHVAQRIRNLNYQYILKLDTKRFAGGGDDQEQFEEIIDKLLPSKDHVTVIMAKLGQGGSLIGPAGHYVSLNKYMGDNSSQITEYLERLIGTKATKDILDNQEKYAFFAGAMFWARFDAIAPLLDLLFTPEDFEAERGQVDGTLAHSLERMLTLLPISQGREIFQSSNSGISKVTQSMMSKDYKYTQIKKG